jgi:hypothetical protein
MPSQLRFLFIVALDMAHEQREVAVFPYARATVLPWQDAELLLDSMQHRGLLEAVPGRARNNPAFQLTSHGRSVRKFLPRQDFAAFYRDCRFYA